MVSKPFTTRWIRTGSQPDLKTMYNIELQTNFYEYQNKNHKIKTSYNSIIIYFDIRGKLSRIRCDNIAADKTGF